MDSARSTRRGWRWFVFLAGIVFVAAAVLLLTPPVQSWLVRGALARGHRPWRLGFDRLGMGPTGLDATGLNFSMPGITATSAPLTIRLAPTRLLSERELSIERVEAEKIRVVLTPGEFAAPSSKPFEGVLRLLQIPLRWQLNTAHLDGDIVVREGGASRVTGHFSLRGGGLGPSSVGNFAYELTANSMILPPGPDHAFSSRGTIRVTQTANHGIGRVELDGDLRLPAYGRFTLPEGSVHATLEATASGENYRTQIVFSDVASLDLSATLDAARHQCAAKVTVDANQRLLAHLLKEKPPLLTVAGTADAIIDLAHGDWHLSLQETARSSQVENVSAKLAALKGVDFSGVVSLKAEKRGEQIQLQSFDAAIRDQTGARVHLVLPHALELSPWLISDVKQPADAIDLRLELVHAPLRWLNGFFPAPGDAFTAGEGDGAWAIRLDQQRRIRVSPTAETKFSGVRLETPAVRTLPEFQLTFSPSVEVSDGRLAADLRAIQLTSSHGDQMGGTLSVQTTATSSDLSCQGDLQARLPSLLVNAQGALPVALAVNWNAILGKGALQLDRLSLLVKESGASIAQTQTPPTGIRSGDAVSGNAVRAAPPIHVELNRPFSVRLADGKLSESASPNPRLPSVVGDREAKVGLLSLSFDQTPLAWASPGSAGTFSGEVDLLDVAGSVSTEVRLKTSLTPRGQNAAIPVQASLKAQFHPVTSRIVAADTFALTAKAGNATATLVAPEPFLFGLSNSGSGVCSTLKPFQVHLDRLALTALKPWLPALTVDGQLDAADFLLTAERTHYTLTSANPLHIGHLALGSSAANIPLWRDADLAFSPKAELDFLCETQPKFEFAYQGRAGVQHAAALEAGQPILQFDAALGFKGNHRIFLADTIDLDGNVHLSALPPLARVPRTGELSVHAHGDLLGDHPLAVETVLSGLMLDQRALPSLAFALEGNISSDLVLSGRAKLELATAPVASDLLFEAKLNLVDGNLNVASGLRSHFLDLSAFEDIVHTLAPTATPANQTKAIAEVAVAPQRIGSSTTNPAAPNTSPPFWGDLRGAFDLDLAQVRFTPYEIDRVAGHVRADDRTLRLEGLSGAMFAGRWSGAVTITHDPAATNGNHQLSANFDIVQFESTRVVQTVFPHQLASLDAKIDVHTRVQSQGNSLKALIGQSQVDFSVVGENGMMHLAVPKADTLASAAVFGGTILLSPELRALGRLIRKLAEMPMDRLSITGKRAVDGEISIGEFIFDSPQLKLRGNGRIVNVPDEPLMNRPLALSLDLAARDELAVILDGMRLLEKKSSPEGFRPLRQPITIGGRTGSPDTTPLYDLFAQAVSGSHGTWGVLMRRLQTQVKKH